MGGKRSRERVAVKSRLTVGYAIRLRSLISNGGVLPSKLRSSKWSRINCAISRDTTKPYHLQPCKPMKRRTYVPRAHASFELKVPAIKRKKKIGNAAHGAKCTQSNIAPDARFSSLKVYGYLAKYFYLVACYEFCNKQDDLRDYSRILS